MCGDRSGVVRRVEVGVNTAILIIAFAVSLTLSVVIIRLGLAPLVSEVRALRLMFQVDRDLSDAEHDANG